MTSWKFVILAVLTALLAAGSVAFADSYSYDTLGRLTGVLYSDGSSVTYMYDPAGNRTVVSQTP